MEDNCSREILINNVNKRHSPILPTMFSHFITALSLSARDNRLNYPEKKKKKRNVPNGLLNYPFIAAGLPLTTPFACLSRPSFSRCFFVTI